MKEHTKLCQKQLSEVTLHCVWGQLSKKQTVERPTAFPVVYHHEGIIIPRFEEVFMVVAAGRAETNLWVRKAV